jgi:urease accessory protein
VDSARTAVRALTDDRRPGEIGRRARLELTFAVRRGRTELVHQYVEPPFRVGRTFAEGDGVHLILASSAPGIFGGDALDSLIVVERAAKVRLTSQSSLQIHPASSAETASIGGIYRVEAGAHLDCEWHAAIPFPSARLSQRNRIDLADGASLFWSDAMMSGREARGERWQFGSLEHELKLLREDRLDYLERYRLAPAAASPAQRWRSSDACYAGTVIVSGGCVSRTAAGRLHAQLNAMTGLYAAADVIEERLMLIRLLARSGPVFHAARERCRESGSIAHES